MRNIVSKTTYNKNENYKGVIFVENDFLMTDKSVQKEFKTATEKLAAFLRGITVPPTIALIMLTYFYFSDAGVFRYFWEYVLAVFFISVLPALAYPFHIFVKKDYPVRRVKELLP